MRKTFFSLKSTFFLMALAFTTLIFSACNKLGDLDAQDLQNGQLKSGANLAGLMEFQQFFSTETQGNFNIRDFGTFGGSRETDLSGWFLTPDKKMAKGGEVSISGVNVPKEPLTNYETYRIVNLPIDQFYGKVNKFSLGTPSGNTLLDSLYTPKSLNVGIDEIVFNEDTKIPADGIKLSEGTNIKWNADGNNKKGVVIIVSYSPSTPDNRDFKNGGFNQRIANVVGLNDSGSYNMEAKLFKGIPKGALIEMLVGRANFKFVTEKDTNQSFSIYAYSTVVSYFRFK
jgi:hypothetical protein